ncbi:MAG TPA: hypothetical protein VMP08_14740 [Anaerolineae bacterium]|nr:hypothetical protein [Anaerolineae bacterium]
MSTIPSQPSVAEVEQIAALRDSVIRNLQITQCYQELSANMALRLGAHANWCTFATWASKQAGQTIRKEDLTRALEDLLNVTLTTTQAHEDLVVSAQRLGSKHNAREIHESVWEVLNPAGAIDRASDAVGRGNKKVFEEIGYEFARFQAACLSDTIFDADHLARFCAGLRPGDPPDGQRYLQQAFTRYYQALFETDPKARLELLLCANLEIGFHEQTRLQPEIAESLDAAVVDPQVFRRHLLAAMFPYRGWLARLRLWLTRLFRRPTPLDDTINALAAEARHQAHLFITAEMMTIALPHGLRLHLGEDLSAEFPPALQQIVNLDLRALLARIDPTPDSPQGSGAQDWADLAQRIHYIADLFRCYADSADLFEPPFTAEQVAQLKAGHLPEGQL